MTVKTEFKVTGTSQRAGQFDIAPETTPYIYVLFNNASIKAKNLDLIIDENLTMEPSHRLHFTKIMNMPNMNMLKFCLCDKKQRPPVA